MNANPEAETVWLAPAKINLMLHVVGRRADGYHLLQTVFQFLDYCDELQFQVRADGIVRRVSDSAGVPEHEDLVVRAGLALQAHTGCRLGADITLHKRIPMGAGLGGGSSDAATTLRALNQLWQTGLSPDALAHIGLSLGADVPVFVHGNAAWAEGVGEQLQPISLPEPWYVVLIPPVHVATAEVFRAPELVRNTAPITPTEFLAGLGRNDCTPVTRQRYPEVDEALHWLAQFGDARMSGTGSAVFLACAERATAQQILQRARFAKKTDGFIAKGCNLSPIIRAAS